jgi:uncharacterized membrane protein HdeD (DUF308 family)
MFIQLSRHWWWLALRGIAAILFGMVALAWRGDSPGSFMLLFGGFALVDGLLAIFVALTNVAGNKRWWMLLHGSASVVLAGFILIWTETAATILLYLVTAWTLITGMMQIVGARRLDRSVSNEELLYLSGKVSILFAVLLILVSKTSVVSVTQLIGPAAIIFGLLTLVLSLNIRNMGKFARLMRQG